MNNVYQPLLESARWQFAPKLLPRRRVEEVKPWSLHETNTGILAITRGRIKAGRRSVARAVIPCIAHSRRGKRPR
jgi:hypothetical protein